MEQGGRALAAYLQPRETGEIKSSIADDVREMIKSIGQVAQYYMAEPQRAFEAQAALTTRMVALWASTLQRLQGARRRRSPPPIPPTSAFRTPTGATILSSIFSSRPMC